MARPKNPERAEQIKQIVARLFAEKGFHATSMRDVGNEIGMSKSSMYNYFKSKEEILFHLMNDAMDEALETLQAICRADYTPDEKLNAVLGFYTQYYAGDQDRLTLLVNESHSLNEHHQQIIKKKDRDYVRLIRSILDELTIAGRMKAIHSTVAVFAFFGMVHYTIKWYNKSGPVSPSELSEFFVEIFMKGILKP
jgi:TetR/AcrR family transcriptional regulator, cholesterol catabolism regulator